MLQLVRLSFKAIGRFVDEQSIDFSSLNDFIQIDGLNKNTGGSSGSAKTTVFNALDTLLGLNDLPATILQSRLTEEQMNLSGDFLWDGKEVSITRGKKLKVVIGDRVIEGSSALAEEQIDAMLGMPRKLFRKLLHKRQKEGGFFLDFTPAKMHEFLIDCLDLSQYRKYDDIVDAKIKDLLAKKNTEETFLNGQEVGLDATREAVKSLGDPPKKQIDQETILGLKKKVEEAEHVCKMVAGLWSQVAHSLEQERPKTQVVPFDRSGIDAAAKEISDYNDKLNALFQEEKDRLAKVREWIYINDSAIKENDAMQAAQKIAHGESLKIAEEVKHLKMSICPTCQQTWANDEVINQIQVRMIKLFEFKKIMDKGAQAYQDRFVLDQNTEINKQSLVPRIDPQIPDINEKLREAHARHLQEKLKGDADIEKQNSANQAENEKFAQKQREVQLRSDTEVNQARGTVEIAQRVLDNAVNIMRSFTESNEQYERNLKSLQSKEEQFTKKIEEVKRKLETISEELILAEETKKAIKMFLSYSFDDALEAIGTRATEIIRCIPNMSNATIQFDGTKETKDGKVKEEVNAVIGMDGEESIPIKSLSGGERSAVDIAVDLAVIDFIETKSGKGINLFILDEPFTGLGPIEIEMALEVLKNSNTNKKIVIVDHNSEVKQMVQNRILVVRDGLTSNIEKDSNG